MKPALERIINYTSLCCIVVMLFSLLTIAFLMFYPFKIIEFNYYTLPVVNENQEVVAGEQLFYRLSYCKYKSLPSNTVKTLHNGFIYHLEDKTTHAPVGCWDDILSEVHIPLHTPPGIYHMEFAVSYEVNPFQTITQIIETDDFRVVSPE